MVFTILITYLLENVSQLLGEFGLWLTLSGTEATGSLTDILDSIQQRFIVCLTHFCSIIFYDLVTESFISVFTGSCIEERQSGVKKTMTWETLEYSSLAGVVSGLSRNGSSQQWKRVRDDHKRRMWNYSALYFSNLLLRKETMKWMCIRSSLRQWSVFDSNEAVE